MSAGGWIKLHRRSLDSEVFADPDLWHLFSWCLMRANHKTCHVSVPTGPGRTTVTVGPGQFVYGRKHAARELNRHESSIYRGMKRLANLDCINIQTNTHYSVVTLVNWSIYQGKGDGREQPVHRQCTGSAHAPHTDKKGKNVKNTKNAENGEASRDDHGSLLLREGVWEETKDRTHQLAKETCTKVRFAYRENGPQQWAADRELRIKVCFLVASGAMPEAWLRDATEAVANGKRKKRPAAYWQECLREGAAKLGKDLNRLLIQCNESIPREVLADGNPARGSATS